MTANPALSATGVDEKLAALVEEITAKLEAGERIELSEYSRSHPDQIEQLRKLLPALEALALVGQDDGIFNGVQRESRDDNGHRQLGDFRLIRELGRGGMGTVYEAEQISMGRHVALKVLPFAALAQDKSLQRFRNEVRAAAALDHPHIVSVYSVGEERGVHYYAMQLIRGQTLADMIEELRHESRCREPSGTNEPSGASKPSPARLAGPTTDAPTIDSASVLPASTKRPEQARISTAVDTPRAAESYRAAARLGIQAAEALQHAHDLGVLHRDIKPSNLMLDREGKLYVTDFGLARIEADAGMTMTGDIVGTLRYMAPEQALAKRVVIDHRADIYSLGATLYELLTLQPAFDETDRSELLKQIAFEEPRPLRKLNRQIPAELETIVLKAMAKNPDERYQTAQRLSGDLLAFLDDRPIHAKPPTMRNRALKWSRRHRPIVVSAAASAAGLAIVSIGMLLWSNMLIARERNETAAALEREIKLRREAEVGERIGQALYYSAYNRFDEAERILSTIPSAELISPDFAHFNMRYRLGYLNALRERWNAASIDFEVCRRVYPQNEWTGQTMLYLIQGPVLLQLGDTAGYEKLRNEAISRYLNTTNPIVAERICKCALILPGDEKMMINLGILYDLVVRGQAEYTVSNPELKLSTSNSVAGMKAWASLSLATVDYRRGDYQKAIERCEQCLTAPRIPGRTVTAHAIEAMSLHRLNLDANAKVALALAHAADEDTGTFQTYMNRGSADNTIVLLDAIYGHILLQEADLLIGEREAFENRGYAVAQNWLGKIYTEGLQYAENLRWYVTRDDKEAVKWFRKAAEQGLAAAQVNLAERYTNGEGIAKDAVEAAKWCLKATDQFEWTCNLSAEEATKLSVQIDHLENLVAQNQLNAGNFATLGAVRYRAGRYEEAVALLERSIAEFDNDQSGESTRLYPRLMLAMSKWQQGQHDEARRLLSEIPSELHQMLASPSTNWDFVATLGLLRHEAVDLIRPGDVVAE